MRRVISRELMKLSGFSLLLCVLVGCGSSSGGTTVNTPEPVVTPDAPVVSTPVPDPLPDLGYVIDVNVNVNHVKGGVGEFDRSKFITMHISTVDNEWPDNQTAVDFIEDNDIYFGRNNGAMPWQLSRLESSADNGVISDTDMTTYGEQAKGWYKNSTSVHSLENRMKNMMYGGQEFMYPHKEKSTCSGHCEGNTWLAGYDEYARFFSEFLTKYFGMGSVTGEAKPTIVEVMNEPFVKSNKLKTTNANITELHKIVADKLSVDHPDVRVGGFTAAYPALEQNNGNFDLFDNTWKTFIDGAGDVMDFYSIHLYDNHNNVDHQYRSGANIEAILDMIEHYSVLKIGEAKPWVISEYGFFSPHHKSAPYSKEIDWWNIRSYSSIMMQLMNKPDQIMASIPFSILKALWSGNNGIDENGHRYGPRMFILRNELDGSINVEDNGDWILSDLALFYQLWSEVNGRRVETKASDIDLQTDAYVDGKTLYFIVNNLEHEDVEFSFDLIETHNANITSISAKHLYYDNTLNSAVLNDEALVATTSSYTVNANATVILKVVFNDDVNIDQTIEESKYYADKMKQPILSGQDNTLTINNVSVDSAHGEAVLRLGVGRLHNQSLDPTITVNGTQILVPKDVRGYDQKNKDSFFGVLEIPVAYELLNTNNSIAVKFSDSGGFITSASLQVFESSTELVRFKQ